MDQSKRKMAGAGVAPAHPTLRRDVLKGAAVLLGGLPSLAPADGVAAVAPDPAKSKESGHSSVLARGEGAVVDTTAGRVIGYVHNNIIPPIVAPHGVVKLNRVRSCHSNRTASFNTVWMRLYDDCSQR